MEQFPPTENHLEVPPSPNPNSMPPTGEFVDFAGKRLHVRRLGSDLAGPPLVFLHEGLGSVELWREFAEDVVAGSGHMGLVYSRYGNGWSTPLTEPRKPDYMHVEAIETLPSIVEHHFDEPPILIGHSDGASIALIYAGSGHPVKGLVLIAPHVFVEPASIASISSLSDDFPMSEMPEKMAKYHVEPMTTFRGWADIWLSNEFRTWDITGYVPGVRCPTLLIQGDADEYGTVDQLDAIDTRLASAAEMLMVPDAEHSPHLSHSELVTPAVVDFIARLDR
jgi:pimeloyl-ACP methyl ester carboxylesterase